MLYDITRPLYPGMPVYPGDPEFEKVEISCYPAVSRLSFGSHSGTHLDAPAHLGLAGGVENIPLETLCGDVTVVGQDETLVAPRLLYKETAISPEKAHWLVENEVRLVGVEGLSIEEGLESHRILLDAGIVILEGLELSRISAGNYKLYCLPLKITGDGAPVRAILEDYQAEF